jgi:uncharacterized membrane protein YdcZ (DUF606 family)
VDTKTIQAITATVISVGVVFGTLAIIGYQIAHGQPVALPSELDILLGGVVGSYFTHTASVNGARQAGVAAAQAAAIVADNAARAAP